MEQLTVSVCHSLKIIPVARLTRFARYRSRVILITVETPDDAAAVPGSVKISTTSDKGIIKKKITFDRSGVSDSAADILESYKCQRVVATYVDENGNIRVAGSPDFPLALDFTTGNGVFTVTLSGEDTQPDGYLAD